MNATRFPRSDKAAFAAFVVVLMFAVIVSALRAYWWAIDALSIITKLPTH